MSDATPRTVTFGASPQDEAQHRSARLGSQVMKWTLGAAAILCALVSARLALNLALSLASTWSEVFTFGAVTIAAALAMCGLPAAAAMLSRAYPREASTARQLWLMTLGIVTLGMVLFVLRMDPQDRRLAPDDWSPRAILSITPATDDAAIRRVMVLALGLLAIAGAGYFGKLAVLASSESYRLAYGEASAIPSGTLQQPLAIEGEKFEQQVDLFEPWAELNLKEAQGASVQVTPAYQDYSKICRINFQEPMGAKQFAQCLQAKAMASRGRITKRKVNGLMCYQGWQLASEMVSGLQVVGSKTPVARIEYKR